MASQALALVVMAQTGNVAVLFVCCAVYGLSVGNLITYPALIIQREFEPLAFGMLVALVTAIAQSASGFGPTILFVFLLFWLLRRAGGNAQSVLGSNEPIISPSWSPDGTRLAYVSFENRKPVVYVQSLVTGGRQAVANFPGSNSAPTWLGRYARPMLEYIVETSIPAPGSIARSAFRIGSSCVAGGVAERITNWSRVRSVPIWSSDS